MVQSKYIDEKTRNQLRVIAIEKRLTDLETDNTHSGEAFTGLLARLDNYEDRINKLEKPRHTEAVSDVQEIDMLETRIKALESKKWYDFFK